MGPFSKRRADADRWDAEATRSAKEAREAVREADKYGKSLASGQSDDPAADRFLQREHDSDRRVAAANARDFRKLAKPSTKKRWF